MAEIIIKWSWREAFSKFGFQDGDGWNGTDIVAEYMEKTFDVVTERDSWGCHNYLILDVLCKNGVSQIPNSVTVGYDEPDKWMHPSWVANLDAHFDNWKEELND